MKVPPRRQRFPASGLAAACTCESGLQSVRGKPLLDRLRKTLLVRLTAAFVASMCASTAVAHDARPLSVTIVEQAGDVYRVVVRAPPTIEPANTPQIVWPDACHLRESAPLALATGSTSLIVCAAGLEGRDVRIDYPEYNPSITTLFRLEGANGTSITAVLPPDERIWKIPAEPGWASVARDYSSLGIWHIWSGPDHLLFVAGLLLLARMPRRIVLAVTGFTAAHSITLSLAALGFVRLSVAPVESMIALSIVFLAAEIARGDTTSFSHRYPVALSFVFGLLHGFGFASALGEIGLPRTELATGLLFFNIGVELGQLAFIAAAAALVCLFSLTKRGMRQRTLARPDRASRRFERFGLWPARGDEPSAIARFDMIGAYALGIPAAYWFLDRTISGFMT